MSVLTRQKKPMKRNEILSGFPFHQAGLLAQIIIPIPELTGGVATSLLIQNNDGAAALGYRLNFGEPIRTVAANGFKALNDQLIAWIEIIPNAATGNWEIEAEIVPIADLKKEGIL